VNLTLAFVYLAAAVLAVPVAKRLGLGAVLGYLLAGVVIGPSGLDLVGHGGHDVMHVAEFGVVMMLFLVGLELRPAMLWSLRRPILGLGGLQVLATMAAGAGGAIAIGIAWRPAVAIGAICAMSSTAIVLASLAEKGLLKSAGGQAAFSVLLFQDIAVIPILAIFPLLAAAATKATDERPGWQNGLLVIGAVGGVVAAGRFLLRPAFRFLAQTRLREIFTAAALLIVVGVALLMQTVGLSPALGTFVAGVVLADSEYRHELESDIEPFKGLLLGIFFISVGAQIDFHLVGQKPGLIAGVVVAVIVMKAAVLFAVAYAFRLESTSRAILALSLAQIGEFAFVLISFAEQLRVLEAELGKVLIAVVALSMAVTPALLLLLERAVLPRLAEGSEREQDSVSHEGNPVIIAGHGRFGQIVGRMLRANGIGTTVLDLDAEMVDVLRRLGMKVFYGDASRPDLLATAGCEHAKLFVLAIDDKEASLKIAEYLHHRHPQLRVLARARDRVHYYELRRAGVERVYREMFAASYEMGIDALRAVGVRAHTAHRLARQWRDHDAAAIEELGAIHAEHGTKEVYWSAARRLLNEAERLLREDNLHPMDRDHGWDNESLRSDAAKD
jgi:glutathione-regulated potassium-efflux system ancillary protein KefC